MLALLRNFSGKFHQILIQNIMRVFIVIITWRYCLVSDIMTTVMQQGKQTMVINKETRKLQRVNADLQICDLQNIWNVPERRKRFSFITGCLKKKTNFAPITLGKAAKLQQKAFPPYIPTSCNGFNLTNFYCMRKSL